MTALITTARGRTLQLPEPLAWEMCYTAGVPCDSFWLRCPWEEPGEDLGQWKSFAADHQGERVFTGVVDECEVTWDRNGTVLEVSGRGMAALLLDNEAQGQDYETAALEDILSGHVSPYGIRLAQPAALPPVSRFSVATGSSEWSVLYEFARYHAGVSPRFDQEGRLVLTGWTGCENLEITDATPVTGLVLRERRYGVLSEIWVRDRTRQAVERVENTAFLQNGGTCRRIMTMPGRSDFKTMRYSGQFQLDKSAAGLVRQEIAVPILFYGRPGDLLSLHRSGWGKNGSWRVVGTRVTCGSQGGQTVLELAAPDVVI